MVTAILPNPRAGATLIVSLEILLLQKVIDL
jgi:hypothetical protein